MAKRTNMSKQYPHSVESEQTDLQSKDRDLENRSVSLDKISKELADEFLSFEEKPAIVISETPKYNKGISNTISIRSRIDALYKTIGAVSGRAYVFTGGGSVVDVNKEDVDELLSRRKGNGCCGGTNTQNFVFELV